MILIVGKYPTVVTRIIPYLHGWTPSHNTEAHKVNILPGKKNIGYLADFSKTDLVI
jgi:hypothetical protein